MNCFITRMTYRRRQHGSSKPDGVSLHLMGNHLHIDGFWLKTVGLDVSKQRLSSYLQSSSTQRLAGLKSRIAEPFHVSLQFSCEILERVNINLVSISVTHLEHGRSAGQHNVFVESTSDIDWALLDQRVNGIRDGRREVGIAELRMEEYLGSQESLVADVYTERLLRDRVDAVVSAQPLGGVCVVLHKFFHYVRTHVTVLLLDRLGHFVALLGRNGVFTLTEQVLDEVGDVATGDRNVLDARSYDVTISDRDAVSHAISRVDNLKEDFT